MSFNPQAERNRRRYYRNFVYEAPVRVWHWLKRAEYRGAGDHGLFDASPLPSVAGEASDNYLMGYIRFTHFAAAYIFAVGFLARIYWALAGNKHAKQLFKLPVTDINWWSGMLQDCAGICFW